MLMARISSKSDTESRRQLKYLYFSRPQASASHCSDADCRMRGKRVLQGNHKRILVTARPPGQACRVHGAAMLFAWVSKQRSRRPRQMLRV